MAAVIVGLKNPYLFSYNSRSALKSRYRQGHAPSEVSRGAHFPGFSPVSIASSVPWLLGGYLLFVSFIDSGHSYPKGPPYCPHLNLIISVKMYLPNQVTF